MTYLAWYILSFLLGSLAIVFAIGKNGRSLFLENENLKKENEELKKELENVSNEVDNKSIKLTIRLLRNVVTELEKESK